MRGYGVAGVADQGQDLATGYFVTGVNADFSGLEMGVDGVAMLAKIEDYGVAVGLLDGNIFWIFSGSLFGEAVGYRGDGGVGYGDGFFAEDGVAGEIFAGAVVDAARVVELFPVDGVALGGWQLVDLALMALVAIELLSLIFLKVVLILLGALLYATGPITIGLVATDSGAAIARAWASAVALLNAIAITAIKLSEARTYHLDFLTMGELVWNLLMRFILFQVFVLLLDRIRCELVTRSSDKP